MQTRKTLVAVTATAVATACSAGVVVAGGGSAAPDNSKEIERALDSHRPKNVILLIGDGTGDSELTIGRYYLNGANGPPMAYETLPFTGEYHTWSPKYGPGPNYDPDYVPDSAPTAVAWSTCCSTIDPSPPTAFVSVGHRLRASAGPWHPRREMCEEGAAGVASLSSAVVTLPTALPRSFMISNVVVNPSFEPGTVRAVLMPCESRASPVFFPVAHATAVGAESGT